MSLVHYNDLSIDNEPNAQENGYDELQQSMMQQQQQHVDMTSDILDGICCSGSNSIELNDQQVNLDYHNGMSSQSVTTESLHIFDTNHYEDVEAQLQEIQMKRNIVETTPSSEPVKKYSTGRCDKCIVCARTFKNPNSLDKHLKNVHTVHIIKPELTTSIKKSSEYRRIVLNKKPIKENVAQALMTKLNKKSLEQQQKIAAERIISKTDGEESQNELDKQDLENNNSNNNNNNINEGPRVSATTATINIPIPIPVPMQDMGIQYPVGAVPIYRPRQTGQNTRGQQQAGTAPNPNAANNTATQESGGANAAANNAGQSAGNNLRDDGTVASIYIPLYNRPLGPYERRFRPG